MRKPRIYIDTSVIGGCFDSEFAEWSNKLFDEISKGLITAVISDVVLEELDGASENIQDVIKSIPDSNLEIISTNEECEFLASKYIEANAVSKKFSDDALHIAIATITGADVLVSWNFKHIVNYNRILKYNAINLINGYKTIEIRSPREVLSYDE